MKRHVISFLTAFAIGCVIALVARSALFKPYSEPTAQPAPSNYAPMVAQGKAAGAEPHSDYPARVKLKADPAESHDATTLPPESHDHHDTVTTLTTVNSVCAICGMEVDPSIKPATYQGKLVGFGCRMCPPKFAREPDRYGPSALENRVVPN